MKPILGYFRLRGWAGPIRLLLAYLDVHYEEKNYQLPLAEPIENRTTQKLSINPTENDWKLEKDALGLQFPNLPYWIEDNVKLTETKAILKHIARTRDSMLLAENLVEKAKVNVWEEVLWDMWNSLCQACMKTDDDIAKNTFLNISKTKLELLSKNFIGPWVAGSKITVVDFILYEILYHYDRFKENVLSPFPELEYFMRRFESIPNVSKYMNSDKFIQGPCFSAKFKSRL